MPSPRPMALPALLRACRHVALLAGPTPASRIAALPRLVRAVARGHYTAVSKGQLALLAVALGYLLLPFDLTPEALLGVFGLVDDAVVASWLVMSLGTVTGDYLRWEARMPRPGDPAVARSHVVR